MKNKLKKVYCYLNLFRGLPALILWRIHKETLEKDVSRYLKYIPYSKVNFISFFYTLIAVKQFRSVFYFRAKENLVLSCLSKILIKPLDSIEISGKISGGILLFHKMGCVIVCQSAGENLTVAHGVTIGRGNSDETGNDAPILKDNVWISTNAVVFGPITLGNNVNVGAGCILNKSVPDNCTVVGNPARIVKRDGVKCNELL